MAQKKKKRTNNAPVARAYLLNLAAGTPKGDAVRSVLNDAGVVVYDIKPGQLGDPVGAIARLIGFRPSRTPYEGEVPDCEFIMFCDISNKQMDKLLAGMREADCVVERKCIVTKYNKAWALSDLIAQIEAEHLQVTS